MTAQTYMAAPVPRSIRQTRLGHLPLDCVIGTRATKADNGANIIFDIIMLPVPAFQRMRMNVGMQQVVAPTLNMGSAAGGGYVLIDVKQITTPADEPDPQAFATAYFLKAFGATS